MLKETTGQTIKYLREKNDLTREDLCQMIRLGGNSRTEDVQRLYKVENDKIELDDSVIETLAQLFDVEVDDFKPKEEWIDVKEAASLLECHRNYVEKCARKGNISRKKARKNGSRKIMLYKKSDISKVELERKYQVYYNKKPNDKKYFTKKLRKLVFKNYNSISQAAKKIGIKPTTFANYTGEDYGNFPIKENFKKICEHFNVEPEYFNKKTNENGYTSKELSKKIKSISFNAPTYLSQFKKEYPNKVFEKKYNGDRKRNYLSKKYYNDFINFLPDKYNKFKENEEVKENTEVDFSIEKQQEPIDKHQKSMILELRETIKSQSAKIRKLNNKVEELENYHNKAEFKLDFFSEKITKLENKIDELQQINEIEKEKVNDTESEGKGFFSRLFS